MNYDFIQIRPVWGVHYAPGYTGFEFTGSAISAGIAWFTRKGQWEGDVPNLPVTHCFLVSGEDQCIEAVKTPGVTFNTLRERFIDLRTVVVFRKPIGWTPALGAALVDRAKQYVGQPYDLKLLMGHGLSGSLLGRLANTITRHKAEAWIQSQFDQDDAFMCSELVAAVMDWFPEWHDQDILLDESHTINPRELFGSKLYEPWHSGA